MIQTLERAPGENYCPNMAGGFPEFPMKISGYGSVLPERVVSSEEIAMKIREHGGPADIDATWIHAMTGIEQRPHVDPEGGETTATLATAAGRIALERSGIVPESIDVLLIATSTPPLQVPATVNEVQDSLGFTNTLCFDISAACSGFVHGMTVANAYLATYKRVERVMLIGADTVSLITNPADQDTAPIFADGAGAMIFERAEEGNPAGILGTSWDNDGSERGLFTVEHGGKIDMDGHPLARKIVRMVGNLSTAVLMDAGVKNEDIDFDVMHQPNGRIIDMIVKRIKTSREKIGYVINTIGNSSAATVPITFDKCVAEGKIKRGNIVRFNGVAVGIGGSSVIMRM